MKRILLEIIMVIALIIISGIVLADNVFLKSDNELLGMNKHITKTHTESDIYSYSMEHKNKMRNMDGVNKIHLEHKPTQLANDKKYFYTNGIIDRNSTIRL